MGSPTRRQVCSGCWRTCKYRYFRDTVPVRHRRSDGYPGAPEGRMGDFGAVADMRSREVTENINRGVGDRLTRAKILGKLHEEKQAGWDKATEECFYWGQRLPDTTEEALRWVSAMGAKAFRTEVQGWSEDTWRKKGRARREVTVLAFLRWWDRVRQRDLEDDRDRPNLYGPGVGPWEEGSWPETT